MPVLPRAGIVDIRLLTFTANTPTSLHYILRRFSPNVEPTMLFLLREIDTKCLRLLNDTGIVSTIGSKSEQNLRTIVNNIAKEDHVWASAEELKALKHLKVLSIRTPKAALVSAPTVIYLLRHFEHLFKALVFESVLLTLLLEQRLLKQFILTLKSSIYNLNNQLGLAHDDFTSVALIHQYLESLPPSTSQTQPGSALSSTSQPPSSATNTSLYPPPYSQYYSQSIGGFESSPPVLDSKLAQLILQILRVPDTTDQSSLYNALSFPQTFPLLVPPDTLPPQVTLLKQTAADPPSNEHNNGMLDPFENDPMNPLNMPLPHQENSSLSAQFHNPVSTSSKTPSNNKIILRRATQSQYPGPIYTNSEENDKKRKLLDSLSALDISSASLLESQNFTPSLTESVVELSDEDENIGSDEAQSTKQRNAKKNTSVDDDDDNDNFLDLEGFVQMVDETKSPKFKSTQDSKDNSLMSSTNDWVLLEESPQADSKQLQQQYDEQKTASSIIQLAKMNNDDGVNTPCQRNNPLHIINSLKSLPNTYHTSSILNITTSMGINPLETQSNLAIVTCQNITQLSPNNSLIPQNDLKSYSLVSLQQPDLSTMVSDPAFQRTLPSSSLTEPLTTTTTPTSSSSPLTSTQEDLSNVVKKVLYPFDCSQYIASASNSVTMNPFTPTSPPLPQIHHSIELTTTTHQHLDGTIELLISYVQSTQSSTPPLHQLPSSSKKQTPFLLALNFHSTAPHHYFPNLPYQLQKQLSPQQFPSPIASPSLSSPSYSQSSPLQPSTSHFGDIPTYKFYPLDNIDPNNPQDLLSSTFPYVQFSNSPTILPLLPLYFSNSLHFSFTKDWFSSYYPQFFYNLNNVPSQQAFNKAFTFSICDEDIKGQTIADDQYLTVPVYNHPAYSYNRRAHEVMHLAFANPLSLLSPLPPSTSISQSPLSEIIHNTPHINPQFLYQQLQALPPTTFHCILPSLSQCPNCLVHFSNYLNRYNSLITSASALTIQTSSPPTSNTAQDTTIPLSTPQTIKDCTDNLVTLQKTLLSYQIGCVCRPSSTTNSHHLQPVTSQYPIPFSAFNAVHNTLPPQGPHHEVTLQNDNNLTSQISQLDSLSFSSYVPATGVQQAIQQCEDLFQIVANMAATAPNTDTATDPTPSSPTLSNQRHFRLGDPLFQSLQGIVSFSTLFALSTIYVKTSNPEKYQLDAKVASTSLTADTNKHKLTQKQLSNYSALGIASFQWLLQHLRSPVIYTVTLLEFEPEVTATFYKKDRDDLYLYPDLYPSVLPSTQITNQPLNDQLSSPKVPNEAHVETKPTTASEHTSLAASVSKPINQRHRRPARLVDNMCSDFYTNNLSHSQSNLTNSGNPLMANSGTLFANFSTRLDPVTIANQHTHCRPNEDLFQYKRVVSKQPKSLQKGAKPYQMNYLHNLRPYITPPTTHTIPSQSNQGFSQVTTLIDTSQLHFPYALSPETLPLFRSLLFHIETTPVESRLRLWRHCNLLVPILQQDVYNPDIPLLTRVPLTKQVLDDFLQNEGKQLVVRRKQYELNDIQFLQNDKLREKIFKSANAQDLMSKLTNHTIPGGFATGGNAIGTAKVKKIKGNAPSLSSVNKDTMDGNELMHSKDFVQLSIGAQDESEMVLSEEAQVVSAILNKPGRGRKSLQFHMLHGSEPKWAKGSLALLRQQMTGESTSTSSASSPTRDEGHDAMKDTTYFNQPNQNTNETAPHLTTRYSTRGSKTTTTTASSKHTQTEQIGYQTVPVPADSSNSYYYQHHNQNYQGHNTTTTAVEIHHNNGYTNMSHVDPYAYHNASNMNGNSYGAFMDPYNYIPTSLGHGSSYREPSTYQQQQQQPLQPVIHQNSTRSYDTTPHPFAPSLSSHHHTSQYSNLFNRGNGGGGLRNLYQPATNINTNSHHINNDTNIDLDSLSEQVSGNKHGLHQSEPPPPIFSSNSDYGMGFADNHISQRNNANAGNNYNDSTTNLGSTTVAFDINGVGDPALFTSLTDIQQSDPKYGGSTGSFNTSFSTNPIFDPRLGNSMTISGSNNVNNQTSTHHPINDSTSFSSHHHHHASINKASPYLFDSSAHPPHQHLPLNLSGGLFPLHQQQHHIQQPQLTDSSNFYAQLNLSGHISTTINPVSPPLTKQPTHVPNLDDLVNDIGDLGPINVLYQPFLSTQISLPLPHHTHPKLPLLNSASQHPQLPGITTPHTAALFDSNSLAITSPTPQQPNNIIYPTNDVSNMQYQMLDLLGPRPQQRMPTSTTTSSNTNQNMLNPALFDSSSRP